MSAVQASAARKPVTVIKRVMIWLFNQLHKLVGILAGRRGMRSPNNTQKISSAPSSSDRQGVLTHSDINDTTVPPVAKRVSLLPAIPLKELRAQESKAPEMQNAIITDQDLPATNSTVDVGKELVEDFDTHRRLDATAAAISTEETPSSLPSSLTPTALSELMSSDSSTQAAADDTLWSSPTVDTHSNYQPPSIHDLLPAIEPEDTDSERLEPIEELANEESAVEAVMPKDSAVPEEPQDEAYDPQLGKQTAKQATLFSFNIYESDTEKTDDIEEIITPENAGAVEEDDAFVASDSPVKDADIALVLKAEVKPSFNSLLELDNKEQIDEEQGINRPQVSTSEDSSALEVEAVLGETPTTEVLDLEGSEPINPWLTAIPVSAQESAQAILPTKLESKSGTVKLLFTIKPGNYHGYITPDDGSKDILFHQKYINADIFDKIERGMSVVVTFKMMAGKAYATRVDLL